MTEQQDKRHLYAFPSIETVKIVGKDGEHYMDGVEHKGLTLLDYFAGQACIPIAHDHMESLARDIEANKFATLAEYDEAYRMRLDLMGKSIYRIAAAMLRERQNWNHETGERKDA